jgi:hypothetical protein
MNMTYEEAKAKFVEWAKKNAYDETDGELWDAFFGGVVASELQGVIAAAPLLLDELAGTLEGIEDVLHDGGLPAETERSLERRAKTIRAAIAKATG